MFTFSPILESAFNCLKGDVDITKEFLGKAELRAKIQKKTQKVENCAIFHAELQNNENVYCDGSEQV